MISVPRLPAIERLFGCLLGDTDEATLQGLIDRAVEENEQLDFKTNSFTEDTDEFAKDVCAFANARGGVLVYGVAEQDAVAKHLTPFDLPTREIRLRVSSILSSKCRPAPHANVVVVPSLVEPDRTFILVVVPKSSNAPHGRLRPSTDTRTRPDETWLNFPIRTSTGTRHMAESELGSRYRSRFQSDEARFNRLAALSNFAPSEYFLARPKVCMRFAAVPLEVGDARIGVPLMNECIERVRGHRFDLTGYGCSPSFSVVTTRYVRRAVRIEGYDGAIEFHADGAITATHFLDELTVGGNERLPTNPFGVEEAFVAVRLAFLQSLASSFAAEGAACSGEIGFRASLSIRHAGAEARPVQFARYAQNGFLPVAGVIPSVLLEAEAVFPIDLFTDPPTSASLAASVELLTQLGHCLGLPHPNAFTAEGEICIAEWGERIGSVEQWAKRHGLPLAP